MSAFALLSSVGHRGVLRRALALPWAVLRMLLRRPLDGLGAVIVAGLAATTLVNALYLQSGPHPAPLLAPARSGGLAKETTGSLRAVPPPRPAEAEPEGAPQTVPTPPRVVRTKAAAPHKPEAAAPHKAEAAAPQKPSRRIMAVQRALAEFGYGPLKPTGVFDGPTRAALEKFARERKLPLRGQLSERLVRELGALTGRRFE